MTWLDNMNAAFELIEAHLLENIDYAEVARKACCSISRFQRMFAFVTDTTLSEYIRNRKMSLSAQELLRSDIKVVDLAMKYGYQSPEAFTRAFQAFHGVPPTAVRKRGTFTDYPRFSFCISVNERNLNLGKKPLLRIEEHGGKRLVSFAVNCAGPEEAAWNRMRAWAVANISDFLARRYIGCAPKGHHPHGEGHHANEETGFHEYQAQMFLLENEGQGDTFMGAEVCEAPAGLYLVGDVAMNEFHDDGEIDIGSSMQSAFGIMAECLADMGGYEFTLKERPYYEEHVFSNEWFIGSGELAGFKLWLPIRKVP